MGVVKPGLETPSGYYFQRKSAWLDAFPTKIRLGRFFREDYLTNAGAEKRYLVLSTNGDRVELGRPDRKPFEVSKYRGPVYGFWVNEKAITREPEEPAQELAQEPANEAARQPA